MLRSLVGSEMCIRDRCMGQGFHQQEARASSCEWRDLCFNTDAGTFQYFVKDRAQVYELGGGTNTANRQKRGLKPRMRKNGKLGRARGFLPPSMKVSLLPASTFHGDTPFSEEFWMPEVVQGEIPEDAIYNPAPVAVLMMQYNGHNFGHVLFDEMFPWFSLLDMFGYANHSDSVLLDYQNFNMTYPHHLSRQDYRDHTILPPDNTCAKFRRSQATGISYNDQDLGEGQETPMMDQDEISNMENILRVCDLLANSTADLISQRTPAPRRIFPGDPELDGQNKLVCFDRLLAGIGLLTEHCTDESGHGNDPDAYMVDDEEFPVYCNAGRGPQFWRFRQHSMRMLGVGEGARCGGENILQVLMNVRAGGNLDRFTAESVAAWHSVAAEIAGRIRPHRVKTIEPSTLSLREQVQSTADSVVMITLAGGGASNALWLPRGGTLIVLSPVDVKDDFVLWGHLSHISVRWIEIQDLNAGLTKLMPKIDMLVSEGLARFSRLRC
eukprot:TRINITY_DN23015_c0_g1_i2.p1 TRINITY_DN23015_c0_g1~~TRINITY_DN23015_c0_g1_i2.p1  ORF type:complete len:496 (-),score=96.02 TRINITY_DN23015_c0_g1_i2:357-1844(-)